MNQTELMLVHLLRCALQKDSPAPMEGVDWHKLFRLCQAHKIDGMLLDTLYLLPEECLPPMEVLAPWQENAMLTLMTQISLTDQLHALLAAFEGAGIRALTLKGIALKPLYPQPDLRTMSDADLLLGEGDFPAGKEVMAASGYTLIETEPGVCVYMGMDGLRVELHSRLFDRTSYGFLSRLDEQAMFPMSLATRQAVHGGEALVFPPKEHALFMLCHMAKHMITTGFGLRQLVDFCLFMKAHERDMDIRGFSEGAEVLGLSAFAAALLSLGGLHLGIPMADGLRLALPTPAEGAAAGLLQDILDAGVFGNRTEERRHSAAVVYRAFDAEDADKGRLRRALFPPANTLKAPYLYARDHPVLLPVAWAHRLIRRGFHILTGKAKGREMAEGMHIADDRLLLLTHLGLRDPKKARIS